MLSEFSRDGGEYFQISCAQDANVYSTLIREACGQRASHPSYYNFFLEQITIDGIRGSQISPCSWTQFKPATLRPLAKHTNSDWYQLENCSRSKLTGYGAKYSRSGHPGERYFATAYLSLAVLLCRSQSSLRRRKKGPDGEMSVWKGRQGLDDSLKVKKCYTGGQDTLPGQRRIRSSGAGDDEYRGMCSCSHQKHSHANYVGDKTPHRPSQHRNPPQHFSTAGTQVIEAQPDQNILSPLPKEDIRQSADVDTDDPGLHANLGDKRQNTRVQVPSLVIDELDRKGTRDMPIEITDVKTESDDDDDRTITNALPADQNEYSNFSADRTKFIFRDATNRIVSEADFPSCNNVTRLFMKARLARIISLNRRATIISARINNIVNVDVGYGDRDGFGILMHSIKSHPCWKTQGEEAFCSVEIRDSRVVD